MNARIELLLKLEELLLVRKGLELGGSHSEESGLESLNQKIERIRRQIPGPLLSEHDRLARRYANVVAVVSEGICQGCRGPVSARLSILASRSNEVVQCEHCHRFLIAKQDVPDYVG